MSIHIQSFYGLQWLNHDLTLLGVWWNRIEVWILMYNYTPLVYVDALATASYL